MRENKPLISVIIPTYNYGHFIGDCIESVLNQTMGDWECIIVDDGSTDETRDIVVKYANRDSRIKYHYKKNEGPNAARLTGLSLSSGSFIQLLDSDDLLEKEKLKHQSDSLAEHPEIRIVYSDSKVFQSPNSQDILDIKYSHPRLSGSGVDIGKYLLRNPIMVSSALVRKTLFLDVPLNPKYRLNEDWEYWIYCCDHGEYFLYDPSPDTFVKVRRHGENSSQNEWLNYMTRQKIRLDLQKKLRDLNLIKLNASLKHKEQDFLVHLTISEMKDRNKLKGLGQLARVIWLAPKKRYILYFLLSLFLPARSISKIANISLSKII